MSAHGFGEYLRYAWRESIGKRDIESIVVATTARIASDACVLIHLSRHVL